jgi:hypothetical protein
LHANPIIILLFQNLEYRRRRTKGLTCDIAGSRRGTSRMVCVSSVSESIELTELEKKIFDRLREVLHQFNLQTQLRVAGGWVRDKVFSVHSLKISN